MSRFVAIALALALAGPAALADQGEQISTLEQCEQRYDREKNEALHCRSCIVRAPGKNHYHVKGGETDLARCHQADHSPARGPGSPEAKAEENNHADEARPAEAGK